MGEIYDPFRSHVARRPPFMGETYDPSKSHLARRSPALNPNTCNLSAAPDWYEKTIEFMFSWWGALLGLYLLFTWLAWFGPELAERQPGDRLDYWERESDESCCVVCWLCALERSWERKNDESCCVVCRLCPFEALLGEGE